MMKPHLLFLTALLFVSACGSKRMIKPGDTLDTAFSKAMWYFDKGKWTDAAQSFETVLSMGRGTDVAEEAQFFLGESYFNGEDYLLAASEYERVYIYYPKSDLREKAMYKEAYSYFKTSPRFKIDQTDTETAMNRFELYLSMFPNGIYRDTSLVMIDMMREKLAHKYMFAANGYMRRRQYKAAAIYYELTMERYPETSYAEEALSKSIEANIVLAENSVIDKRLERFQKAIDGYQKYVQIFPRGRNRSKVEGLYDRANDGIRDTEKILAGVNVSQS